MKETHTKEKFHKKLNSTPCKPRRILKMKQVSDRVAMGKSLIYKRISEGNFPRQVRLSGRAVGWFEHEIENYLESLERARG